MAPGRRFGGPLLTSIAVVAMTALQSGCGDDGPTTAATTVPAATDAGSPDGDGTIVAEAYQVRTDEAIGGQFQVQLVNRSDEPFTVQAVRLESAGFEQLAFEPRSTTYSPGQRTDMTTKYGAVICEAGVEPAATGLKLVRPDGQGQEVHVTFESVHVLERIHRRECAARAFAEAVDMHLGELLVVDRDGRPVVATDLILDRRSSEESFAVDAVSGSVLMTPTLTSGTGRELPVGEQSVEMPFELEVRSCDPHLLADTKKPFDFTVQVRIGDGDVQPAALVTSPGEQQELWAYILDYCATR
jgi:hypothetical protein